METARGNIFIALTLLSNRFVAKVIRQSVCNTYSGRVCNHQLNNFPNQKNKKLLAPLENTRIKLRHYRNFMFFPAISGHPNSITFNGTLGEIGANWL